MEHGDGVITVIAEAATNLNTFKSQLDINKTTA
jgi:hypothetical protein